MALAVVRDHPAQVGAQFGQRCVLTDIDVGKPLRQFSAVTSGQNLLGEIAGKPLVEKVMAAKALERVGKDGAIAAGFQPCSQSGKRGGFEVLGADQV
jgi:hypothetical protein